MSTGVPPKWPPWKGGQKGSTVKDPDQTSLPSKLPKKPISVSFFFYKKLKNVSCEYYHVNGWNSTLQAAWYNRYLHKLSFARVLCFILMKDIGRWLPWMLPGSTGRFFYFLFLVLSSRWTYSRAGERCYSPAMYLCGPGLWWPVSRLRTTPATAVSSYCRVCIVKSHRCLSRLKGRGGEVWRKRGFVWISAVVSNTSLFRSGTIQYLVPRSLDYYYLIVIRV